MSAARAAFIASLAGAVAAAVRASASPAPCVGGRFAVPGPPLLGPPTPVDGDAVAIVGTLVSTASGCEPVEARLTPRLHGTRVHVRWPACRGTAGPVRLKGRIVDGCRRLDATLVTPYARPRRRRFTAMRTPFAFVQPVDVAFRYEDEHVIAFFDGHPDYEAVEAFVADRPGLPPLVRAIITRHDETQVDHLNDAEALAAYRAANPLREAVFSDVKYANVPGETGPHARLEFVSFRGEQIVLDLFATSPASADAGGLTDPAGHAPDVLPILWRDASAVAGPATTLTIDGTPYTIPGFLHIGDFVGLNAFYTAGFAVGSSGAARSCSTAWRRRRRSFPAPAGATGAATRRWSTR